MRVMNCGFGYARLNGTGRLSHRMKRTEIEPARRQTGGVETYLRVVGSGQFTINSKQ